ncbi:MAG: hypothetical protein AAF402_03095 [Pseudomonadota bacterium]
MSFFFQRFTVVPVVALAVVISLATSVVHADQSQDRPLYLIFDASNSMWGELPDKSRKITTAKSVFNQLEPSMLANRPLALRLYGHRRKSDCSDTELAVPFDDSADTLDAISAKINSVSPRGKTPISRSLTAALEDFNGKPGDILLISDGIETCDDDPCALVQSWRRNNIDIRVHVVGLGLTEVSRNAMSCIAEASSAQYTDADSAKDLELAIIKTAGTPLEPGTPNPTPDQDEPEFHVSGVDANGAYLPVSGLLRASDGTTSEIKSSRRYVFEGGTYEMTVGVPTVNGILYKPITQVVDVSATGTTHITVELIRPPVIRTLFVQSGEEIPGVLTRVENGEGQNFNLRTGEDYFILPGNYNFSAELNQDNKITVTESVVSGDNKDIVFDVIVTVNTRFEVYAGNSEKPLRFNQELWQHGKKVYDVHIHNGADIRPGTYTLRADDALTPYVFDGVTIPTVDNQVLSFRMRTGSARVSYPTDIVNSNSDLRCWLRRIDENGKNIGKRSRTLQCNGSDLQLVEGRYRIRTWSKLGKFEETTFNIKNEQSVDIILQPQN